MCRQHPVFFSVAPRRLSWGLREACHGSLMSGGRPSGETATVQRHARILSRTKMPHVLWA